MQYNKNILFKYNLCYLTGTCWGILGYNRGVNQYEYNFKNDKYNNKKIYLYTNKISNGIMGIIIYIIPCFLPIILFKEFYRLEINLRKLESEKRSEYYNKIL